MTPEVKKRIDQIRNGIVPEGYKKGKLGIVPGEWDEIPFSTLFTSTSDYTDNLHQYPLYSLTIEDGITAKTERYERSHLVKKDNSYKVVRPNDYAYNPMNIRFGAVARHKGDIPVAVSGYYDIFTTVHKSDLVFMDSFLTCGPMITYYNKVSTGSLIEKQRVHFSDFLEFSLALPPLEERKKIAEILTTQDKAIELERQRIDEILKVKQFFLGQMFPKKGQAVPEIRFKGFTGVWEQRKLSEMCGTFEYGLNAAAKEFDGKNKYIRITDIDDASREFLLSDLSSPDICLDGMSKYLLSSGDIVFARTGASVGKTYIYRENDGIVYFAGFLIRAKVNQDNDAEFVFQSTLSPSYEKYIRITSQRSGQPGVNAQEYSEYDLFAPSKEEQQRIGHFLRGIDNLITLHQHKLEEEKKKKKALMQLLLTGIVRV